MLIHLNKEDSEEFQTDFKPLDMFFSTSPCGMGVNTTVVMENDSPDKLEMLDAFMKKHHISYTASIDNKRISSYFASEHDRFRLTPFHIF
jgi:hypothetical protein